MVRVLRRISAHVGSGYFSDHMYLYKDEKTSDDRND